LNGLSGFGEGELNVRELENFIRKAIPKPVEYPGGSGFTKLNKITQVLMLEEAAAYPPLHETLKNVLNEKYNSLINLTKSKHVIPLFAGSRGLAFNHWENFSLKDVDSEVEL
jgi:hypothetical protein